MSATDRGRVALAARWGPSQQIDAVAHRAAQGRRDWRHSVPCTARDTTGKSRALCMRTRRAAARGIAHTWATRSLGTKGHPAEPPYVCRHDQNHHELLARGDVQTTALMLIGTRAYSLVCGQLRPRAKLCALNGPVSSLPQIAANRGRSSNWPIHFMESHDEPHFQCRAEG